MKPADNTENLIKKLRYQAGAEAHDRILNNVMQALDESEKQISGAIASNIKRTIMKSKIARLAAPAVIIIAVVLTLTFLRRSATPVYALDQTIEANHSVRYIHIKHFDSEHEDEPTEFWIECGEFGQTKNARIHLPEWSSPEDGAQIIVWKENKIQIWLKKKNIFFIASDKTVADIMLKAVNRRDPRLAVQHLYERQQRNEIKVSIDQSSDKAEPILITATHLPDSSTPDRRTLFFVDRATKLVTCTERYRLRNGKYEYESRQEYYDYNQQIADNMFSLDDELPDDVILVDQTTQEIGLAQGQLSEKEIAVEVVRQSFEALITKDYVKAGKLLNGIPADLIEKMFGHIKFLRILSIGPVAPHPVLGTEGWIVPCIVEIEKDGEISQWKFDQLGVRQVYNQPGRWTICGGFRNHKKVLLLDR